MDPELSTSLSARSQPYIALLGKRDSPTDGVADYCEWLQSALQPYGATLSLYQARWKELGWLGALWRLWQDSIHWRGTWVVLQYVAFSWSYTGVALGLVPVVWLLRWRGTRLAVIFHDTQGFPGDRPRDRWRRASQHWLMGLLHHWTDCSILTIPPSITPWLPLRPSRQVAQIPVGSNVPEPKHYSCIQRQRSPNQPIVSVFGITGGANGLREIQDIAYAVRHTLPHIPDLHLVVMGRGSDDAEADIRTAFQDVPLKLSILGLLPPEEVAAELRRSDVLLFVRGNISSGRTSAVAGVASGVPIVAYRGTHTGFPITQAGVVLLEFGDKPALAAALLQVLMDPNYWQTLHQRNLQVWRDHFAWDTIAKRFLEVLPYG